MNNKVYYGIILPDLSRRSTGDTPLKKDAKTEDYQKYINNLHTLIDYIKEKNLPNFFGIDKNLFENIIVEKRDYLHQRIEPLDDTQFFVVYDNLINGRLNDSMHISSLYERVESFFFGLYDNRNGNGVGTINLLKRLEDILIEKGCDEVRLAGERLWYLETKGNIKTRGKGNIVSYDSSIISNIADIATFNQMNGTRRIKHLRFKVINGCTFPLNAKPVDKGDEKHFTRKVNQDNSFKNVRELLKESVSLNQVLSGI